MFNRAMSEGTRDAAAALVGAHDFSAVATLVDVGGGDGTLLSTVLATTPGLRGVLFDTPVGLAGAGERLAAAGVADRCDVVAGDFFAEVPGGADAYVIKSVVHDWDDDRAATILANCRKAIAGRGTLLVVEPVLPPTVQPSFETLGVVMSDLNMLVCAGGRERTEAEFTALLAAAGFRLDTVVPLPPTNYRLLRASPA
jgi:hypothetical protein